MDRDNLLAVGVKGKKACGAGNFIPDRKLWTRAARRFRERRALDFRMESNTFCPKLTLSLPLFELLCLVFSVAGAGDDGEGREDVLSLL